MKIAFYQPHLDIQGTGVCYFDLAYFNEKILGNKSYVIHDKGHSESHPLAVEKFEKDLQCFALDGEEDMNLLEQKLAELDVDAVYIQKCGKKNDGRYVTNKPMLIHVIGTENDPHGKVYAYASEWLSMACSNFEHPYVPYIVRLPESDEDLREELDIPRDAVVFSRIGGYYSWNIPFTNQVVVDVLKTRDDCYFLFVQTHQFIDHPRVIHIPSFADLYRKRKFINTSDAFLHSRAEGESFGMACAEYSICNKPVITYKHSKEQSHIFTLGDKGLYYEDPSSLHHVLNNFMPSPNENWNCYGEFTPEKVMEKFKKVFLNKIK